MAEITPFYEVWGDFRQAERLNLSTSVPAVAFQPSPNDESGTYSEGLLCGLQSVRKCKTKVCIVFFSSSRDSALKKQKERSIDFDMAVEPEPHLVTCTH
jgi:hypothetical protein